MGGSREPARANVLALAALTLSAVSLFVAISGAATAGNTRLPANSVGSKQLKTDAVKPLDVAPGAIGSRAIQPRAVTAAGLAPGSVTEGALGPDSVTEAAVAPDAVTSPAIANGAVSGGKLSDSAITGAKIAPGAVDSSDLANEAVTGPKIGPRAVSTPALSIPELTVTAAGLATNQDMGDCQGFSTFLSFTAVRANPSSMFSAGSPTNLVAPVDGVYSLSLAMDWSHSDGYVRASFVSKAPAGGGLELVGLPGEPPGPSGYAQTIDAGTYELEAGDALRVAPVACGAGMTPATAPTLDSIEARMEWVAQPGG